MEKKYWKSQGKVREFCHPGKVGTLRMHLSQDSPNKDKYID